jgi:cell wall-associated NlpC family hydrolase
VILTGLFLTQTVLPAAATPQDDKAAIESEITQVSSSLNEVIVRYDAAYSELIATEEAIANRTAELEATRGNLETARRVFDERARGIYKYGDVNVLEVIFSSRSINDFAERFEILNRVGNADANLVVNIEASERDLEKTRRELEAARIRQAELFAQVEADKADVENAVAEKRARLSNLEDQIALQSAGDAASDDNDSGGWSWSGDLPPAHAGVVAIAYALIGVPYVYGGTSPDEGFDCSGFVGYCYARVGISLNRTADYTPNLGWNDLQPGDLVYSHSGGHVGIYSGGGMQIHAPYPGTYVQEGPIYSFCGGYRP